MRADQTPNQAVPDHVPAALVWDRNVDEFNRELEDPYVSASRLHDGPDIVWASGIVFGNPGWVLTRYEHIQAAFIDHEHFSSDRKNLGAMGMDLKLNPLEYDPPEHYGYRRILNPFFTPKAVSTLDEAVEKVCRTLTDEITASGSCEFMADFAEKFPSYIFLDLLGLPRDMLADFLVWERDLMRAADPRQRVGAMMAVMKYLEGFVEQQCSDPDTDLMRGIVSGALPDGRPLDRREMLGMVFLLYIGGLDTVLSTLGWIFRHLAGDRALQDRLRDHPDDIPRAVEEFLRMYPVAAPHRTVKEDVVFNGILMKKGDEVLLPTYLAGRDPRAFADPHRFDIDRNPRHISFGSGPHACLGLHLARRELRTVLHAVLSRCRNIRMVPGSRYEFHTGGTLGVDRLELEWDAV